MKKELVYLLEVTEPFFVEVMTWLPDEAYDIVKNIMENIDENGADWATEQISTNVIKRFIPIEIYNKLMDIMDNEYQKNEEWALEKVCELGREMQKLKEKMVT